MLTWGQLGTIAGWVRGPSPSEQVALEWEVTGNHRGGLESSGLKAATQDPNETGLT